MNTDPEPVGEFLKHAPRGAEPGDVLVIPEWGVEEWSTLFSCTQPVDLDIGEVLIQAQGDDRMLYFVASGRLEVATIHRAGFGISRIATISPGSVVGELAFFDAAPRSAKVWAATRTRLLGLTLIDYERYVSKYAEQANAFLFAMARLLSYRLRTTSARV